MAHQKKTCGFTRCFRYTQIFLDSIAYSGQVFESLATPFGTQCSKRSLDISELFYLIVFETRLGHIFFVYLRHVIA